MTIATGNKTPGFQRPVDGGGQHVGRAVKAQDPVDLGHAPEALAAVGAQ
jgi:hypothetical protein